MLTADSSHKIVWKVLLRFAGWKHWLGWGTCKLVSDIQEHKVCLSIYATAVALFWEEWYGLIGQCVEIPKATHLDTDTRRCHGELGTSNFCGNTLVEIHVHEFICSHIVVICPQFSYVQQPSWIIEAFFVQCTRCLECTKKQTNSSSIKRNL